MSCSKIKENNRRNIKKDLPHYLFIVGKYVSWCFCLFSSLYDCLGEEQWLKQISVTNYTVTLPSHTLHLSLY